MKFTYMKKCAVILVLILFFQVVSACSSEYYVNKIAKTSSNYNINATLNVYEHTMDAVQTVVFSNNSGSTLNNLKFNLYVKAFSKGVTNKPVGSLNVEKAYPNGLSYGDIVFTEILSDGQALTYVLEEIDKNILNVALIKPLKAGYSVKIEMKYQIKIPNIHHRFGYGENTINLGNFYPILCVIENGKFVIQPYSSNGDPFYSDLANYKVVITHPSSYKIANTGIKTEEKVINETTKQTSMLAKTVRDFCLVLSDKFEVIEQKVGKTNMLYYYYDDENYENSLKAAVDSLKTFSNLIGEYPYETLSVVKTNFVHGGMEYPNIVYISDIIDNYEDYLNVIIHEIAHQWWYGIVGNNSYKYGWLDEGLTEYTTALFYEINPSYNIKKEDIIKNALAAYNLFQQVYEQIFGTVDTSLTRTLGEFRTEPEYVYMAYVKAMLLFDELRSLIGDRAFFRSLKHYYIKHRFENVTPNELIKSFEISTNRKLKNWFDSWTSGKVIIKEIN